jgi:hypothetical protein
MRVITMELNRCTSLSVQGINFTVYFFSQVNLVLVKFVQLMALVFTSLDRCE